MIRVETFFQRVDQDPRTDGLEHVAKSRVVRLRCKEGPGPRELVESERAQVIRTSEKECRMSPEPREQCGGYFLFSPHQKNVSRLQHRAQLTENGAVDS